VKRNVPTQRVNIVGAGFQPPPTSPPNLVVEFFDVTGAVIDTVGLVSDEVSFIDQANITVTLKTVPADTPLTPGAPHPGDEPRRRRGGEPDVGRAGEPGRSGPDDTVGLGTPSKTQQTRRRWCRR